MKKTISILLIFITVYSFSQTARYIKTTAQKESLSELQEGTNPREEKEMEISDLESDKQFIYNKLIASGLYTDTNNLKLDSIIDVLILEEDYKAKYNLIPLLLKKEDYDEANNQINNLENDILNLPENKQAIMQDYVDYLRIIKDYKQSNFDNEIIADNIDFLEQIAEKENTKGSVGAQILLESLNTADSIMYNYPEKIDEPLENKSMLITNNTNNKLESYKPESEDDIIMIYPNPAKNNLIIEYSIIDNLDNSKIELFDLQGKLMLSVPISKQFDLKTVDISTLPNGNYLVKIGNYSKQFTIKH